MKFSLNHYYLQPYHSVYLTLTMLDKYLKWVLLFSALSLISFPCLNWALFTQEIKQQAQQITDKNQQIVQHQKWIETIENQHSALKDEYFAQINTLIKNILDKHYAKIENMQWHLNQTPSINLTFSQNSSAVFAILQQLNQLEKINFSEIVLLKDIEQQRIIATVQLTIQRGNTQ